MPDYFQALENLIGEEVVALILKAVEDGQFLVKDAEEFTGNLESTVKGNFIHEQNKQNFSYGRRAMKDILSDWYNKCAYDFTKYEAIPKLINALREAKMNKLAADIEKVCPWLNLDSLKKEETIDKLISALRKAGNSKLASDIKKACPLLDLDSENEQNLIEVPLIKLTIQSQESGKYSMPTGYSLSFIIAILSIIFIGIGIGIGILIGYGKYSVPMSIMGRTRSIKFKMNGGMVDEFWKCPRNQSAIPNFPKDLNGSVGIYTGEHGILVCGGTDKHDIKYDPRLCYIHKLGSDSWERFPYRLNTNRRGSYAKLSENRIYIIGGVSSDFNQDCYRSWEVLDLDKLSDGTCDGWIEEEIEVLGDLDLCFIIDLTIEIPCM